MTTTLLLNDSLLEAFSARDYAAMARLFSPDVRLRAVTPRGATEVIGAEQVAAQFEAWFGWLPEFRVADSALGEVGGRPYVSWHVAGVGGDGPCQAEQHVFLTGTDRVESLDLVCSGYRTA